MPTIYDFRNRIAVITGGAQGIGRAIAETGAVFDISGGRATY